MIDDLVKRLRLIGEKRLQCTACYKFIETADEAADRIEKLEAENAELQSKVGTIRLAAKYAAKIRDDRIEKLEAALLWYAEHCQKGGDDIEGPYGDYGQRARKALEGKDD